MTYSRFEKLREAILKAIRRSHQYEFEQTDWFALAEEAAEDIMALQKSK